MADSVLTTKQAKRHVIEMSDRSELKVSGVEDVISYDENCIVLETS